VVIRWFTERRKTAASTAALPIPASAKHSA
jgi:hypothetical protein